MKSRVAYHFTALVLLGCHFLPYSFPLYPLSAFFSSFANRQGRIVRLSLWIGYACAVLFFASFSYFFRYSYVNAANHVFLYVSAAAAAWAFIFSIRRSYSVAYAPFLLLVILNAVLPNSHGFMHRVSAQPAIYGGLLILVAVVFIWRKGFRVGLPWIIIAAAGVMHTGNSVLPLLVILFSLAAVFTGLHNGFMQRFNPVVHFFSVLHLLLFLGLSQFYSNSLPHALDSAVLSESINPVHIYGSTKNNLPRLSQNDNRFLSADPSGKYFLFGARRSHQDLFRISRDDLSEILSTRIDNTSDNIVFTPTGSEFIAGSFGGASLIRIDVETMQHARTGSFPYSPIRLAADPVRNEVFVISEFSGGSLFVYDMTTLKQIRKYFHKKRDRNFRDIVVDSSAGRTIISQWMDLVLLDSASLEEIARIRTANRGLGRLALDVDKKIVYLSHSHSGQLLAFSYGNGKLEKSGEHDFGFGIRDLAYDPVHNRVAVANYFSGVLTCLDMNSGKQIFSIDLGNRMRHVEFADGGESILTTTMAGGFIVNAGNGDALKTSENSRTYKDIKSIILKAVRLTTEPSFSYSE